MITTVYNHGKLMGWVQPTSAGLWRALTPSGTLTHHQSYMTAMEALQWAS